MRYGTTDRAGATALGRENITRPIEIVRGYRSIANRLHVGIETVRRWASQGAPIRFDGQTPLAEVAELWAWCGQSRALADVPAAA